MWNLKYKGMNEVTCKTKIELQMQKADLWLPGGKEQARDKLEDWHWHIHTQLSSVAQSCLSLCNPMNRRTSGLPVHHLLTEFTQTTTHKIDNWKRPTV